MMFVIAFLESEDCGDNVSQDTDPPKSHDVAFQQAPPGRGDAAVDEQTTMTADISSTRNTKAKKAMA